MYMYLFFYYCVIDISVYINKQYYFLPMYTEKEL
jgi:hypothetical protein